MEVVNILKEMENYIFMHNILHNEVLHEILI